MAHLRVPLTATRQSARVGSVAGRSSVASAVVVPKWLTWSTSWSTLPAIRTPTLAITVAHPSPSTTHVRLHHHHACFTGEGEGASCSHCGRTAMQWAAFCEDCGFIQAIDADATYFKLLDIPESFDLDVNLLESRFKAAQRLVHPDRFSGKSQEERKLSEKLSSEVNIAYVTLRDPWRRAEYLLKLQGIDVLEQLREHKLSFEVLMEIMECREALSSNPSEDYVRDAHARYLREVDICTTALSSTLAVSDTKTTLDLLARLQYFSKLLDECAEFLHALETGTWDARSATKTASGRSSWAGE